MEFGSKYLRVVSLDSSIFNFFPSLFFFPLSLFLSSLFLSSSTFPISKLSSPLHPPLPLPLSLFHTHKLQMNTHSASGPMLGIENSAMRSRLFHRRAHSARRKGLIQGAAHCDMHRGVCQHRGRASNSAGRE